MTRWRGVGLWVYITVIALVGSVVHWLGVRPWVEPTDAIAPWLLVAIALAFFAAERFTVHVRLGSEAIAFSMSEVPLVVGLFFVRPDLLIVARLIGGGLGLVWQRTAFHKLVFNCALMILETSVAVLVWNLVLGSADPLSPRGWLATGLAVLGTSVISSTLVTGAIFIASGQPPRSLDELFSLGQIGDLANACLALVAVYLLATDWRTAWMLGGVVAILAVAYRSSEGARLRSESLEQVNRFTELVGRDVEVEALVGSILREVRSAFEVSTVQLRLSRPLHDPEDWTLVDDTVERTSPDLLDSLEPHAVGGVLLSPRSNKLPEVSSRLQEHELRDCLMVPLRTVGEVSGCILVADRLSDVTTFTQTDVSQLRALANHAAVVLENAVRAATIIRQAEAREHEALHDELTGLANRRLFANNLAEVLRGNSAALLVLDLDRFKEVNDTLGHDTGDRLLTVVAARISEIVPNGAVVARLGGDEFAVLLPGSDDLGARACAAMVREVLAAPISLDGFAVAVDASVGVAVGTRDEDASTLMQWADLAMYAAKESRTGLEVYRRDLDNRDSSRLGLLADLRDAVASNTLEVHYQPKVDLMTGAVIGAEALARWNHPVLGPIGPDEFIPLAEHSTLITPLTMLVLRTALSHAEQWKGIAGRFSIAVNISPRSLLDPTFVDEVTRTLARSELPASALILEITETNLMSDPERAIVALERLREVGVRLSVDDLGTGYSSLAYLQRLPVDEIKIDRSFLAQFDEASSQAVVGAIVDLGHRLGKHVVAEGVENSASFEALRDLGCDSAQGFLMAKPMPADQMTRFLESRLPPLPGSLRLVR
jgi:diguanylate cyclase (GGDEF)-like protein